MKILILFRHAKSDWDAKFEQDRDRPLNKRGKRAAKRMGRYLAAMNLVPDRAIASPADRAAQTVSLAAKAGGWECEIELEEGLYEADPQRIMELIRERSAEDGTLMVVGHEPGLSETAGALIGGGHVTMKTATIALIEFDVEHWSDIRFSGGSLIGLISPNLVEDSNVEGDDRAD